MIFQGSMVALITPMHEDGSIDKNALYDLIEWHIAERTNALVVCGTTGESATLLPDEQADLLKCVVKQVNKRIPVIAGAGTNGTQTTLYLADNAKKAQVDACLIVTPYYNKPTQAGLYEHYKNIAEHIKMPIIIYNVPARTACDILPETVERLGAIPHIIGIKEATGNIDRAKEIRDRLKPSFEIYSGDDPTSLALMQTGAQGVISVTANVAPRQMQTLCELALNGRLKEAEAIQAQLMPIHHALFLESNPIPTKWALNHLGKIKNGIRLPLLPLDKPHQETVKQALQKAGVT